MDKTAMKLKMLRDLMGLAKSADAKRFGAHLDEERKKTSGMHPLLDKVKEGPVMVEVTEESHVPAEAVEGLGTDEESPGEMKEGADLLEDRKPEGQEMKSFEPVGESKAGELGKELAKHEASDDEFEKEMDKRFRSRRK